jgi:hypothetical protein
MAQSLKDAIERARKMVLESIYGQMGLAMKVNGKTMKSQATGSISGQMAESISDIGKVTLWMNLEYIHGKMEECMKGSTRKIKSMDLESTHGQIRSAMLAGGQMANNTVSESSYLVMEKENWESGRTVVS